MVLEVKNINITIKNKQLLSGDILACPGEITTIKGPIGSGKTTFYHHLFHLNLDVFINKQKVEHSKDWYQAIAYVNQNVQVYNQLTLQELIDCFCFYPIYHFKDIGVDFVPTKKVKQCSEGEKQRICLLVALWKRPSILLLDEPTSFLDSDNHHLVLKIIKDYTEKYQCITLLSTHVQLDDRYSECQYEIIDKKVVLSHDSSIAKPLSFQKNNYHLRSLILWEKKNVIGFIHKIVCLLFIFAIEMILFSTQQIENTKTEWFESQERYALSYSTFKQSQEIYCKEQVLEIDGEYIVVGVMNYYDGMNMYTKNSYKNGDVIVNDALYRKLNDSLITLNSQSYEITNVMTADTNKYLETYRYMVFIPNEIYLFEDELEPIFHIIVYNNEKTLESCANNITEPIHFINISSLEEQYQDLTAQLSGYRVMLSVVPIVIGVVLVVMRWVLERKYSSCLNWLSWYGINQQQLFSKVYSTFLIPLLFVIILIVLVVSIQELSTWAILPYLVYVVYETCLILKYS